MPATMLASQFEKIQGPADVDLVVESSFGEGRSNAGAGREVNDAVKTLFAGQSLQAIAVANVSNLETKRRTREVGANVAPLLAWIVVVVKIVHHDHSFGLPGQEVVHHVTADESAASSYQEAPE